MSPINPDMKQGSSGWNKLPGVIRLLILEALMQDGCTLSCFATGSREWQTVLERHNFARIKLTPLRTVDFGSMIHRNRALVGYIWFCLEVDDYDCTTCAPTYREITDRDERAEAFIISNTDNCPITTAFQNLFSALSTWDHGGDLTLDISIYPPNVLVGRGIEQTISDKVWDDPKHGWLPSVPAVITLLLRQQNRRRWKPDALAHMLAQFPRLQEVHYEPWREWCSFQGITDRDYGCLFESVQRCNNDLKRLVVFGNFNQQYPVTMIRFQFGIPVSECDSIRKPSPSVNRMITLASLKLEHLAASFIVDAGQFFKIEPSWEWPNLTSLALTMLQAAAAAAKRMPQLKTMEIWNGRKGLAALFKYQALLPTRQARITWRGTWILNIEPFVIQAWEAEQLEEARIKSHSDAIHYLMLSSQVIRPISLQQIRIEQKALEGVRTMQHQMNETWELTG
ncbi:hypothetical protein B0T24DRAFT_647243 [Lasiosphaeria ovina]|uniref:DUF6546 domain-containing protein n=1 Tax=Lasiosphaeria ovina TaxID=92902 RepID=A0AAE0NE52_9PEZI|nr:hypothetical protein B0T24DRAFT_647243 [Lasiosphaeria ovina]